MRALKVSLYIMGCFLRHLEVHLYTEVLVWGCEVSHGSQAVALNVTESGTGAVIQMQKNMFVGEHASGLLCNTRESG